MVIKATKGIIGEALYKELIDKKLLTIKQLRFCAEYLSNDFNGTRAYMVAFNIPEEKYGK